MEDEEFMDENDEIVTLISDDDTETDMLICARVLLNGRTFCLMQPLEMPEDMEEDEAIPFEEFETEDGFEYELVEDDDLADAIFIEYEKEMAEEE